MAIRPVDLQLAYLAAPQNAAVVSAAQEGPQAAQQAAASAFAAEVVKREESIDEPRKAQGQRVHGRRDRDAGTRRDPSRRQAPGSDSAAPSDPAEPLPDDDAHLIDFTA